MAYTKEQIDKALETVLGQGASYEDVVGAAGQYGLSQADVDAAYSRRTPASVSEPLDLSGPADIAAQNAVTAEQNAAAASDLINKEYWAWNDPRYAPEDSPGQYGLEQYWNKLLEAANFDMTKAYGPIYETVDIPKYDDQGYITGYETVTRPKMVAATSWEGDLGYSMPATGYTPEYYKAIDALRAAGYDVRARNPDADTYNTYYGIIGPGGKVLQDIKVKGGNASGWDIFGQDLLAIAPIALQFIPGIGTAVGTALGATGTAATVLGNAVIQGGLTAARGGDLEDVLKSAAVSGIGSLATPYINELGGAVSEAVGGDTLGKIASGAVTGAARSGLGALTRGTSIADALASGAVSGGAGSAFNLATNEARGLMSDIPKPLQDAILSGGVAALRGGDVGSAVFRSLLRGAAATARQPSRSEITAEGLEDIYGDDSAGVTEPEYTEDIPSIRNIDYYTNIDPLGELKFNFRTNSEGDYLVDEIQDAQQTPDIGGQPSSLWDTSPDGILAGREDEFLPEGLQSIPVTGKKLPPKDIIIPDWDRQDVIIPDWDINPPNQTIRVVGKKLPPEEDIGGPLGRPEDTSPGGGTTGREDEVLAPAPTPAPSPAPAPRPAPTPTPAPQADTGGAGLTPQQYAVLNAILAGKMGAAYDPYLLGKAARERREKEASLNELMAALGFNQQA